MNSIYALYSNITQGQATLLASFVTAFAAIVGVLLGYLLLNGRVKDLKSAIENSENLLRAHQLSMTTKITEVSDVFSAQINSISNNLGLLDEQFRSKLAGLGKIESSVDDLQRVAVAGNAPDGRMEGDKVRQLWFAIRDLLEDIAASPVVDGRTRARYSRIDRRQYQDLIEALDKDNRLGRLGQKFRDALDLWYQYRSGRNIPNKEDVQVMQEAASAILQSSLVKQYSP